MKHHRGSTLFLCSFLLVSLLISCLPVGALATDMDDFQPSGVIRYWDSVREPAVQRTNEERIAAYMAKYPDVKVEVSYVTLDSSNVSEQLIVAIAGGNPPDLVDVDRFLIAQFETEDILTDLTPYIDKLGIKEEEYNPYAWLEAAPTGKLHCIPYSVDTRMLLYNKAHFVEVGLDPENPPKTIEELDAFAEKLTIKATDGRYERLGFLPWDNQGFLYTWAWAFGGAIADGGNLTINSPEVVSALEWMVSYVDKYGSYEELKSFCAGGIGTSAGSAIDPFYNGILSMRYGGTWELALLESDFPDLDFGYVTAPSMKPGEGKYDATWGGGFGLAIPKGVKDVDTAMHLANYLTRTEEGALDYLDAQSVFSAYNPLNAKLAWPNLLKAGPFCRDELLPKNKCLPPFNQSASLWDDIMKLTDRALAKEDTPQNLLDELQAKYVK